MASPGSPTPRIELLVLEGCPNAQAARELIDRVSAELSVEPELEVVVVPNAQEAEQARFLGSPTIRVDGRDVEPGADARTEYTFACRVYETAAGLTGVPEQAWFRAALRPGPPTLTDRA